MSNYSEGLRHGREGLAKLIAEELAADVPDAEKLEWISWLVAAQTDDGAALPVRRDGGDAPAAAPSSHPEQQS